MDAKPKVLKESSLECDTSEGDSPVLQDTMAGSKRVGLPGLEV